MYVSDLAGTDQDLPEKLTLALGSADAVTFSLPDNTAGGCILKLPENDGYLIQIFPPAASRRMIDETNVLGYELVGVLVLLYIVILAVLIQFYRSQQKQVEEARNLAEAASQAKTSFLFNMSHDIRTPMNAILGYTDIGYRHAGNEATAKDNLKKIKTAGGHLLNLINDILEMNRIESGNLELAENPMDIREVLAGVEQMGQSLAISKSIDFTVSIGEITEPYVLSDELHLNEVLINLISNGIKYTPEGGDLNCRIEQLDDTEDGKALFRFEISDNGIGMSEEFQTHLFEAFSRENSATVTKIEGAGLGLSIVKKIVDMTGGTISVNSRLGEGSVFTVEIPFRVMDDAAVAEFLKEKEPREIYTGSVDLSGKRVLLVEDNEMNREIASDILSEAGLVIDTAEDGQVAVQKVAENGAAHYDFILMDIQMPVLNGYEATREIRRLPDGWNVPIIALSANAFAEDRKKAIEAGMDAHTAKPMDVKELLDTITGLVKRSSSMRP